MSQQSKVERRFESTIRARAEELLKLMENCGRPLCVPEYVLAQALTQFRADNTSAPTPAPPISCLGCGQTGDPWIKHEPSGVFLCERCVLKIRGDIERVNLSTGERFQRVTGDGESRLERVAGPEKCLECGQTQCSCLDEQIWLPGGSNYTTDKRSAPTPAPEPTAYRVGYIKSREPELVMHWFAHSWDNLEDAANWLDDAGESHRKQYVIEASAPAAAQQWVSVEERYPPRHEDVLCLNRDGDIFRGRICMGMHKPFFTYPRGFGNASNTAPDWIDVTHWMLLSALPAAPVSRKDGE